MVGCARFNNGFYPFNFPDPNSGSGGGGNFFLPFKNFSGNDPLNCKSTDSIETISSLNNSSLPVLNNSDASVVNNLVEDSLTNKIIEKLKIFLNNQSITSDTMTYINTHINLLQEYGNVLSIVSKDMDKLVSCLNLQTLSFKSIFISNPEASIKIEKLLKNFDQLKLKKASFDDKIKELLDLVGIKFEYVEYLNLLNNKNLLNSSEFIPNISQTGPFYKQIFEVSINAINKSIESYKFLSSNLSPLDIKEMEEISRLCKVCNEISYLNNDLSSMIHQVYKILTIISLL